MVCANTKRGRSIRSAPHARRSRRSKRYSQKEKDYIIRCERKNKSSCGIALRIKLESLESKSRNSVNVKWCSRESKRRCVVLPWSGTQNKGNTYETSNIAYGRDLIGWFVVTNDMSMSWNVKNGPKVFLCWAIFFGKHLLHRSSTCCFSCVTYTSNNCLFYEAPFELQSYDFFPDPSEIMDHSKDVFLVIGHGNDEHKHNATSIQ